MTRKVIGTSVRLTEDAKQIISQLTEKLGLSQSALLELAIRRLAEREDEDDYDHRALRAILLASKVREYNALKNTNPRLPTIAWDTMYADVEKLRPFAYIDYIREAIEEFERRL